MCSSYSAFLFFCWLLPCFHYAHVLPGVNYISLGNFYLFLSENFGGKFDKFAKLSFSKLQPKLSNNSNLVCKKLDPLMHRFISIYLAIIWLCLYPFAEGEQSLQLQNQTAPAGLLKCRIFYLTLFVQVRGSCPASRKIRCRTKLLGWSFLKVFLVLRPHCLVGFFGRYSST